jgi:hypothetical protein
MKQYKKLLFATLLLAVTIFQVSAGTDHNYSTSDSAAKSEVMPAFDFFGSDDLLEITLQFNMRDFIRTRMEYDQIFDARLTVKTSETETLSQNIKLNARGKMRRKYCSFPPIKLKIKKSKNEDQVFPKINLKLVTHCSQAGNFENYILKEYLAYKLYNLVTPYSFKTRLVIVNYVDSVNPKRILKEYGILIEDVDDLAARKNAIVIDNHKIGQNHMDSYEMIRVALFNYMIGNTDWSVAEQHNVKILKIDEPTSQMGIPITYDYDYSGFVNTSYASPNDQIPIRHVTERYFQGGCYSEVVFRQILSEFEDLQPQIIETIVGFPYLPNAQKKIAESYINSFFRKYKREEALLADLNRTCLRKN